MSSGRLYNPRNFASPIRVGGPDQAGTHARQHEPEFRGELGFAAATARHLLVVEPVHGHVHEQAEGGHHGQQERAAVADEGEG